MTRWMLAVIATLTFFLGSIVGYSIKQPSKEVVENTKEVNVIPQACIDAINYADKGFNYAADALGIVSDMFKAIDDSDWFALQKANIDLQQSRLDVEGIVEPYNTAKEECRQWSDS